MTLDEVHAEIEANDQKAPCWSKWRHLKSNGEYIVMGHVIVEADMTPAVIYRPAYDEPGHTPIWCRPAAEFFDGRFKRLGEIT